MFQQTSEAINREVFRKLTIKNKEVRSLLSILEEREAELESAKLALSETQAALAEAKQAVEDSGNAEILRKENVELHKNLVKAQQDLEASNLALGVSNSKASEQAEKDKSTIRDLTDALNLRLEEVSEIDNLIGDTPDGTRAAGIRAFGETWNLMKAAATQLVDKFLPVKSGECSEVEKLPGAIMEVAESKESFLRSAARGGARMALGLMRMHYPSAKSWRVASGVPQGYTDMQRNTIFGEVKGHATQIASMVNISINYPEAEIPPIPQDESSEEESDA